MTRVENISLRRSERVERRQKSLTGAGAAALISAR